MTNTITVRLRRPKAEVLARAKPNVNAWINDLIDEALRDVNPDWEGHFEGKKARKPVKAFFADELRDQER